MRALGVLAGHPDGAPPQTARPECVPAWMWFTMLQVPEQGASSGSALERVVGDARMWKVTAHER